MTTKELVEKARAGDRAAFAALTRQYQNLVFGIAFGMTQDFHLAQDAAQETFIACWFALPTLHDSQAFPGWLRSIARHQCSRVLRQRPAHAVPLDQASALVSPIGQPAACLEAREWQAEVQAAIRSLPPAQREAILLFYFGDYAQREIAAFLGVPITTVNNRLHAARSRLKRRMLTMVKETVQAHALPETFAENVGKIVQVRGPLLDAQFAPGAAPELFQTLRAGDQVRLSVVQRLEGERVRGLSQAPLDGAGLTVSVDGEAAGPTLTDEKLAEAVRLLRRVAPEPSGLLETGIKVVDLLCPLTAGGALALFGRQGAGRGLFLGELLHRLADHPQGLSLFYLVSPNDRQAARAMLRQDEEFVGKTDVAGTVQNVWLLTDRATDPAFAATSDMFEAVAYFSPLLAAQGLWPALDPLLSRSHALDASIVGPEHCETARRVRETLARAKELMTDPVFLELAALGATAQAARRANEFVQVRLPELSSEERLLVARARKVERFFTQPFFVAEPYAATPGKWVSRAETIQGCQAILNGARDALPEDSFRFVGNWAEVNR